MMNSNETNARRFFDQLTSGGDSDVLARLYSFPDPASPAKEGPWLEMKSEATRLEDRFGRAISGFANNEGGVLIFGIKTDKDADGVDTAVSCEPLPDAKSVAAQLNRLQQHATDPPVIGIDVRSFEDRRGGFVVCFVPASQNPPHRSLRSPGQSYFIRNSDRTEVASHSLLQRLFYPRSAPLFWIEFSVSVQSNIFQIDGYLENRGAASADGVNVVSNRNGLMGFHVQFTTCRSRHGGAWRYEGGPIHPGQSVAMLHKSGVTEYFRETIEMGFPVRVVVFCRDCAPQFGATFLRATVPCSFSVSVPLSEWKGESVSPSTPPAE